MIFPPADIATKLLVAIGIGLLVGFERQWAHKDLGVRTFAIISLLGTLSALISQTYALVALGGVVLVLGVMNFGQQMQKGQLATTTSGALLVTFTLGVLVGEGHVFTPTASAILMTLLLSLKPQFSRFAGGLSQEELRGAVLLALLGFVVYPVLPNHFVDPWQLLNPREAWLTVILIATIGFVNYVLLRLYSTRGIYYTAIFGGLVNSTATIAELTQPIADAGPDGLGQFGVVINRLTIVAMFVRNLTLLTIFNPRAGLLAAIPISVMAVATLLVVWRHGSDYTPAPILAIGSPFSLRKVASFGALFLLIQILGSLGQRWLGEFGTVGVSVIGGFVSSASSTAAAASLSAHRQITNSAAALATVLTSIASASVNLPIIYRRTRNAQLVKALVVISVVITGIGLAMLALVRYLLPAA